MIAFGSSITTPEVYRRCAEPGIRVAVEKARAEGDNPSNGYDRILTRGYHGKGTVE